MLQQYAIGMNVNQMIGPGVPLEMVLMPAPPPPPSIQPVDLTKTEPVTPEEIVKRMRTKYASCISLYILRILYFKRKLARANFLYNRALLFKGWAV